MAFILGKARFFTTVDAVQGYHQVPLHEDSQHLTTFVTPWGRFKFLRGTMGLNATGDEYNRRSDEAVGGFLNTVKVVDDLLVYEETFEEHVERVRNMLQWCREHQITLSSGRKFSFARERVEWAGYVIGPGEISPDPAKLEAITKFPAPTNITEMRRFMGMVEQMAEFSPHISAAATPLRPLLSPSNPFIWNADHEEAFESVKKTMVDPPSLRQFDPLLETALHTDASRKNGLGYVLLQKHPEGWHLVQAGSRFVTDAESNYAMVELEMKGVEWAVKKCHFYLAGMQDFTVVVDHQALISILNKFTLDAVENPRLQRMKERLSAYNFHTTWKKGKDHAIPDALSRALVADPTNDDIEADDEIRRYVRSVIEVCAVDILDYEEGSAPPEHLRDPVLDELRSSTLPIRALRGPKDEPDKLSTGQGLPAT